MCSLIKSNDGVMYFLRLYEYIFDLINMYMYSASYSATCIQLAIVRHLHLQCQNTTGNRFLYNTAVTTLDVICLLTKSLKRNFKSNKLDNKKNRSLHILHTTCKMFFYLYHREMINR